MEQRYSGSATITLTTEPNTDPHLLAKFYETADCPHVDLIEVETVNPTGYGYTVELTAHMGGFDNTIDNQWHHTLTWLEASLPDRATNASILEEAL